MAACFLTAAQAATSFPSLAALGRNQPRASGTAGLIWRRARRCLDEDWSSCALGCAATAALVARCPRQRRLRSCREAAKKGGTAVAVAKDPKVVLLGDSVLDNFYWLKTPKRHLRVQLQETLQSSKRSQVKALRCVNLAVDQMTTFDFAVRKAEANPWETFAAARRKVDFDDDQDKEYIVDSDGTIRSLDALKGLPDVQWAVLSLGGNDVYLKADVKAKLASSLLPGGEDKRQEVAEEFGRRFREVVAEVRRAAPKANLILVIPYRPHQDFSLVMGAPIDVDGRKIAGDLLGDGTRVLERGMLPDLVTPMVREILATAREVGCPVIDLSQTLDWQCEEHYGTGEIGKVNELGAPWSGAEPSDVSTGFIAKLVAHAVAAGPKPVVYRGVPRQQNDTWSLSIKEEPNDWMTAEDYQFGGRKASKSKSKDGGEVGPWGSFAIGVALATLVNGALMLQGGDPLGFDRAEVEKDIKAELLAESAAEQKA